jgi:hypothetical protein
VIAKNAGEWQIRGDAQPGLDGTPALELAQFSNDQTMSASTLSMSSADSSMIREQESRKNLPLSLYFVSVRRSETTFAKRQTRLCADPQ